jgi:OOP family OmpA-OmpF porin
MLCAVIMLGAGAVTIGCHHAPPPKVKVERVRKAPKVTHWDISDDQIHLPGPVVFRTGSADLDPVSDAVLEVVLDYLVAKPEVTQLRIEGHTDNDGNPVANQTLSERRALAVAFWLADAGIDCTRLVPVGFGDTKPIVPNTTPDNKAQNRRVGFHNASIGGKLVRGRAADGGGHIAGVPCR